MDSMKTHTLDRINDTKSQISAIEERIVLLQTYMQELRPKEWYRIIKKILYAFGWLPSLRSARSKLQDLYREKLLLHLALFEEEIVSICDEYIKKSRMKDIEIELSKLKDVLDSNKKYLNDNIRSKWRSIQEEFADIESWYSLKNRDFIDCEKITFKNYFDHVESNPLTDKQQEAVIVNEKNNLILAGAGSGKTSVIVAKVGYIMKKGYAAPEEILVLAFNKKAQQEVEERIEKKLGVRITVNTFHSFGLQIIAKAQGIKPSLCSWSEDGLQHAQLIRQIMAEKLEEDKSFYANTQIYFVSFFAPYKAIEEFETLGEYYEYIRNHDIRTLKGEKVKSFEECMIANQLYMWDIDYRYEVDYEISTASHDRRQYKPDFYLPEYGIYIEHFGISKDGCTHPDIDAQEYQQGMIWKREIHEIHGTKLIETYSYENSEGVLLENLKQKLIEADVPIGEKSKEEVLKKLNESGKVDDFSKLLIGFMNHFRTNKLNLAQLQLKAGTNREKIFLKIFAHVYEAYKSIKIDRGCIDFDDMITMAVDAVKTNAYHSDFKYILVDEFQDISAGRSTLVKNLVDQVSNANLTVVGDDWQSINRFAGSDISIIQRFEELYGDTAIVNLDYTFRFNDIVSNIATDFILKNPLQIEKKINTIKQAKSPSIYLFWYSDKETKTGYLENILSRIANNKKDKVYSVKLLGRYNFQKPEKFGEYIRKYENILDISFNTVHSSKGLEADFIILLDMESGKYGFPSEFEDDPLLNLVMPQADNFKNAEERRLFYVALTRTKQKVFILASKLYSSVFVREIIDDHPEEIYQVGCDFHEITTCPTCKTGILVKRKGPRHWFYGCSNFPYCNYTERLMICPKCKKHEVKKDLNQKIAKCIDPNCNGYLKLCRKCNDYMVLREGTYGQFLGCSSYPNCKYSENLPSGQGDTFPQN